MPILIAAYWLINANARGTIWAWGNSTSWNRDTVMAAWRVTDWNYDIAHSQSWTGRLEYSF